MLWTYVRAANDTSILARAIPLAEKELAWWRRERSVQVNGQALYRYHVNNSAPRPESYYEDYLVTNGDDLPSPTFYSQSQRNALWAELATGAESGWDYSTRWLKTVPANGTNNTVALRTLNIREIVPVDLNSILCTFAVRKATSTANLIK
jgi:alpha,alpha-trehalase